MEKRETYRQILRSTALIGGSSALNIAFGIVRTKAAAVFLGPGGFGLMGLYGSIADLTQSLAGMGVQSSGVRQIADAAASSEHGRVASTASVVKLTSVVLGLLGAAVLIVFASHVSQLTFGNQDGTAGVVLLSVAVLLRVISAGQGALIQGMRRVSDLARINVISGLFGTVITIWLLYTLGVRGVVPSIVAVAAVTMVATWWYSRKLQIRPPAVSARLVGSEATALLKLGFAFMASGLMTMGSAYAVRIIVLHKVGVDATGLYQAAWTLGGLYVGFILQAMGADFYPRLTASARDDRECNRLVNEQARVGLLLGCPGGVATLTLAPFVIALFYTATFSGAVDILRWICLGVTLRVITWPMGFIILAKGRQNVFFWTEACWTVVNIGLTWLCVTRFGLRGAGMAFFGSYVFHGVLIYVVVRRLSGFRWTTANTRTILFFLTMIGTAFAGFSVLPWRWATGFGVVATVACGAYSLPVLLNLVAPGSGAATLGGLRLRLRAAVSGPE